jgi:hypothetical protein
VVIAYAYRVELLGTDEPVRLATAGALVIIGWAVARNLERACSLNLRSGSSRAPRASPASWCDS